MEVLTQKQERSDAEKSLSLFVVKGISSASAEVTESFVKKLYKSIVFSVDSYLFTQTRHAA